MKKILSSLITLLFAVSMLTGCGTESSEVPDSSEAENTPIVDNSAENVSSECDSISATMDAMVYQINTEGNALILQNQILPMAPQNIMDALTENGTFSENVNVISFHLQNDGKTRSIALELPNTFSNLFTGLTASEESLRLGALVNSMLDSYAAESLILTCGGNPLVTDNGTYDSPLSFYEN